MQIQAQEVRISSAHRTPEATREYVLGVPLDASSLQGMDALLSTVQMPGGTPVGCLAVGKAGAKTPVIWPHKSCPSKTPHWRKNSAPTATKSPPMC